MSTPNNSRFLRLSVKRVEQEQLVHTGNFLEAVERLEKAVASLGRLLADHAETIAHARANGLGSDLLDEAPTIEEISNVFRLPRAGVARFLHAMVQLNGEAIPDGKLCALIGCSQPSLKVYASEARAALHDLGIERGISRERSHGYYMNPAEIAALTQRCSAARRSRRRSQ